MKTYQLPKRNVKQAMADCDNALHDQHMKGIFDESDPNHPKYNNGYNYATGKYVELFGYSQDEFLAKQYK